MGDPVSVTVYEREGTFPFAEEPLLLPPGFVFYPEQSIVFGYPQVPGIQTIRIQVKDAAGTRVICETTFRVSPIRVGSARVAGPTYQKPFSLQYYAVNAAPPYSWALAPGDPLPAGLTFSSTGLVSGTPLETPSYRPTGRITDGLGNSRSFRLPGYVSAGTRVTLFMRSNDTPFLTLNRLSSYTLSSGTIGSVFTWTVTGTLPPGMAEYENPDGSLTLWGIPNVAGSYPITVRMTDADGNTSIRLVPLRVTALHGDSRTLPAGIAGVVSEIHLTVDGGTPPYHWSVATGSALPAGMNLSNSGMLYGAPSDSGFFRFTATVVDAGLNTVNLDYRWTVDALRIPSSQIPQALPAGQPFSLQLEVLGGSPGYTWALLPSDCSLGGLVLTPSGLLSGTPGGSRFVQCNVVVIDSKGAKAGTVIGFYIGDPPPPSPPRIIGPVSGGVSVGDFFFTRLVVFATKPSVTAAPGSELPPGLTADSNSLSGYPTMTGKYAFRLQVTDALGKQDTARAYISVSPLHIVPLLPPALYNHAYSYQFRVLEQEKALLWSIAATDRLPAGLTLSPDGLLSGVPVETGPFTFTVRANDASAEVTLTIDSTSGSADTLYLPSRSPIAVEVGQTIAFHLTAIPLGLAPKFSIVSGTLPPGLQLSPDGQLSGVTATAGVYRVTVRFDASRSFGVSLITIRVGVVRGDNLTLPAATAGRPYTAQLKGGTLPPGDSLPPGLTLAPDGKLSGTPAGAWLYKFSVLLTDSTGDSVASTYTLEVLSP